MSSISEINWFPGHMAKTRRLIQENLPKVDLVMEMADARAPRSSRNPELPALIGSKAHILLLSKADLADPAATADWLKSYQDAGLTAVALDIPRRVGMEQLGEALRQAAAPALEKAAARGVRNRSIRAMALGIPNSGKSTLINALAKRRAAKSEDRPGVTRAMQWIHAGDELMLMDMPGLLWPKLGDDRVKFNLAATGAIRGEILPSEDVAFFLLNQLCQHYPSLIETRFSLDLQSEALQNTWERYEYCALRRGCVRKGGAADSERFAKLLLGDFRQGRIGRVSLEFQPEP